jgi:hypothetical protein
MRQRLTYLLLLLVSCCPLTWSQDTAADAQIQLVNAQIARFPQDANAASRVFFVGFAGFGEERVFAEEIKLAARRVGEMYGSAARSVLLINDRRDVKTYPLASVSSLRHTLRSLGAVMNRDDDVLFLALSSHGSPDATIEVSNEGMTAQTLSAQTLADLSADSGIRWKVIVVSACFSGTFIKPLADDHTIVITAAARNRSSFGCSDTRELTYFGEAFYREALSSSTDLHVAFDTAREAIRLREKAEGFKPSRPQASFGKLMEAKLKEIESAHVPRQN